MLLQFYSVCGVALHRTKRRATSRVPKVSGLLSPLMAVRFRELSFAVVMLGDPLAFKKKRRKTNGTSAQLVHLLRLR